MKQQYESVVVRGVSDRTRQWVKVLIGLSLISISSMVTAADLRVMKTGLGKGWVTATGITCGIVTSNPAKDKDTVKNDCTIKSINKFPTKITLTAKNHAGTKFSGWGGDCSGTNTKCEVTIKKLGDISSVRANFTLKTTIAKLTDLTPTGINTFLAGPGKNVNTPAEFVAALPDEYRQNWVLMTRSESLQTGTGAFPRIMLVSENSEKAFTLGLAEHSSYPGSHPNAIEYMQWNAKTKNFHFHEIVVSPIPAMDETSAGVFTFAARNKRELKEDDVKCFACHSTRNVPNKGTTPGTTGIPNGSVKVKGKPNWDTYDNWGGMLAFNRDRIYQGSIEAAAFRKLMNLWNWQANEGVRSVIEQLALQPPWVGATVGGVVVRPTDRIERWDTGNQQGGPTDGHIRFDFDPAYPTVKKEPIPAGTPISNVDYTFNRTNPNQNPSTVIRNNKFVVLQHSQTGTGLRLGNDEGRGTNFFNNLYLDLNPQRIVDEISPVLNKTHIYATGGMPIDVRPIALAIANECIGVTGGNKIKDTQTIRGVSVPTFFATRNGMNFNDVFDDTGRRAASMARRKADIQKLNLDRTGDKYISGPDPAVGLLDMHLGNTNGLVKNPDPNSSASLRLRQLRQEIFRRPTNDMNNTLDTGGANPDITAMRGNFADREDFATNTAAISLYRFFLEPLGVSVDKWSLGVRARSLTYSFADNFDFQGNGRKSYTETFQSELTPKLGNPANCASIMKLVKKEFKRLPSAADTPPFTDIQRIFNKSCIECHGGLNYAPVRNYSWVDLNFSENENPPAGERRLWRSLKDARSLISGPTCGPGVATCTGNLATNVNNSNLYARITDNGALIHPYNPNIIAGSDEDCPYGVMPCGGPPLSKTDIETVKRWIIGGRPSTEGDPHIRTVNGVRYDFQSTGEFVLLRDAGLELQARQSAVTTAGPLHNNYTDLNACVSLNSAVAMRVGEHRVSYQPDLSSQGDEGFVDEKSTAKSTPLILRVDGKSVSLTDKAIKLNKGGRIVPTNGNGGMEVQFPGGTRIAVSPYYLQHLQLHMMNINVYHARATQGIMGTIAPNNWLPRLANGDFLGRRPIDPAQRFTDLYDTFALSWRVDASTSLFDYEPGLNPDSFIVPGWPATQNCQAPAQPGMPKLAGLPNTIDQTQAEQLCAAVVDPDRRNNCIVDVKATGEPGFAESYLESQKLDQRTLIAAADLKNPKRNAVVPNGTVDFEWTPAAGTQEIDVTHYHCLWKGRERYDFNNCDVLSEDGGLLDGILPAALEQHLSPLVCVTLLILLLVVSLILFLMKKRKASLFLILVALILSVLCWLHIKSSTNEPTSTRISDLEPGESYSWKVVSETSEGMVTESPTYRFEVKK